MSTALARLPLPAGHPLLDAPAPRTRGILGLGLATLLLFGGGFGAWSALAPLAEASVAPGVIKVEGTRRTIQHLEGGIVREILVRDGARVEPGQVLMRLDDVQAEATLATQRAQRWALLAQDARLAAEIERAPRVSFPAELLESPDPRAAEAATGQQTLFEARTASLAGQVQVFQARIEQQQAVIQGARGQILATRRQLDYARQEAQMRRGLVSQGLGRLPELLALQRAVAGLEGSAEDLAGQIERAEASIAEARRSMQQAIDQRLAEAGNERREVRAKLAECEEKLRAARDVVTRREITAPEAGTILNQRVFTLGAVVKPGDPLFDLQPLQDRLVAEVNLQPNDIDVVHPGLRAEIRLPAFKQRLVPFLHGQVSWVAADVTTDEKTHQSYYRAFVLIDREQLQRLDHVTLTPGMPVEAHLLLGQRSFFRYLTQPIQDSFHRAFQEQ